MNNLETWKLSLLVICLINYFLNDFFEIVFNYLLSPATMFLIDLITVRSRKLV